MSATGHAIVLRTTSPQPPSDEPLDHLDITNSLKSLMWRAVGVRRQQDGLEQAQNAGLVENADVVLHYPALGDDEQHGDRLRPEGLRHHREVVDQSDPSRSQDNTAALATPPSAEPGLRTPRVRARGFRDESGGTASRR